jgi:hypothetical protein
MVIDLCLGEWIRIGDITLVVLSFEESRIQIALEGVDHVPDLNSQTYRDPPGPSRPAHPSDRSP